MATQLHSNTASARLRFRVRLVPMHPRVAQVRGHNRLRGKKQLQRKKRGLASQFRDVGALINAERAALSSRVLRGGVRMTRCALWTLWLACASALVLGSACNVNRLPLQSAELVGDSGFNEALEDAGAEPLDAEIDAEKPDETVLDAAVDTDAARADGGGPISTDAGVTGTDAPPVVDAYVPPQRFASSCLAGCADDESCVRTTGLFEKRSYCAQACSEDRDCGPAPAGGVTPRCSSQGLCRLPCDAVLGAGCPSDMVCLDALLILPGGDGTCAFVE